jgi:glycosyltransferase involved in cell wall biosynthesis
LADVSVIVPTLNRTALLARALLTVLAQRNVEVEVLVVDDGSTPPVSSALGLGDLLSDSRVRVIRHDKTQGVSAARNSGISAASAPWVAFLDDDDLWANDKLAAQLKALANDPGCSWSYTGEVTMDENLRALRVVEAPSGDCIDMTLLHINAVPGGCSSVLASTAVIKEAGGFDESFSVLADWDLWIRLALLGRPAPVAEPLVGYFKHSQGMSFNTRRSLAEFGHLEEKYRSVRKTHHVEIGVAAYLRYIADIECRAGRRWSAATNRFRVGLPLPGPGTVALSIATFAAPGLVYRLLDRRSRQTCAPAKLAAARQWLDEMFDSTSATGGHARLDHNVTRA